MDIKKKNKIMKIINILVYIFTGLWFLASIFLFGIMCGLYLFGVFRGSTMSDTTMFLESYISLYIPYLIIFLPFLKTKSKKIYIKHILICNLLAFSSIAISYFGMKLFIMFL